MTNTDLLTAWLGKHYGWLEQIRRDRIGGVEAMTNYAAGHLEVVQAIREAAAGDFEDKGEAKGERRR